MDQSLAVFLYKIVSLLVGLAFAYMGYRLFMSSVWGQAGELDAQFGKNKILLKKAAPGTFFALFGAVVIALTIWKGLLFETTTKTNSNDQSSQQSQITKEQVKEPPKPEVILKEEESK
jgi:hypothetical protein